MKSILDPSFKYANAASTDLRKTFARVRRDLREKEERKKEAEAEQHQKVRQLKRESA
jgi:hypothetical protein